MKTPMIYFGGKTIHAERIASLLPPHGHYVEPFCGSLSVLLAKPRSAMETVSDLDGAIVAFWKCLRDRPADLARVCALTPHSLAEFRDAEDIDAPADELEMARRVWIRLTQGRAGTLRNTGWRHFVDPGDCAMGMPGYLTGYVNRMAAAAERLHHVSLECRPALELCEWYGRSPGVLLYLDPPYLRSTRNSGAYRHEMTEQDHRDLAKALAGAKASVVLSGYPSDLYDLELYPDWHRTQFASGTGQKRRDMGQPHRGPVVQPAVPARLPVRYGGHGMTLPEPAPQPMTRKRLETLLGRVLPGERLGPVRERILGWVDAHVAHMIELYARPDDRWGPQ